VIISSKSRYKASVTKEKNLKQWQGLGRKEGRKEGQQEHRNFTVRDVTVISVGFLSTTGGRNIRGKVVLVLN
jgi:hypothetical protein